MVGKPFRQVTPPSSRIWLYGIGAALLSSVLNYGWLYLCVSVFQWPIRVPAQMDPAYLVDATPLRIVTATCAAVLTATIGATLLAKTVIGPRIWWLLLGTGFGVASTYAALTVTEIELMIRIRLAVMHIITMIVVVPILYRALQIRDSDLEHAARRWQDHMEQRTIVPAAPEQATAPAMELDFHPESVVGMTESDATAAAMSAGRECRVMSRDGQAMTVTLDYRADRVNLVVEGGIVTDATVG
jgi:hypothetical protein